MPNKTSYVWMLRPVLRLDLRGVFRYARGARYPAWFLFALPCILVFIFIFHKIRKDINWPAAIGMIFVSEVMLMIVEHISINRGHWVYNENRIIGLRIWDVPIEEPLIYYWIPQLFVVGTMLLIRSHLKKIKRRVIKK